MEKGSHAKISQIMRVIRRCTAVFLILIFTLVDLLQYVPEGYANSTLIATESPLNSSLIPENMGRVEDVFRGSSGKTIFFIQDAHDSLEAQENIASMITKLVKDRGIKTVFEEGYEGLVPTDNFFGFIKSPKNKQKVSYFLLDKLRLSGAEYAHINRADDFKLIGVENLKLYGKNIEYYKESSKYREEVSKDLEALFTEISNLANQHFPGKLRALLKTNKRFLEDKLPLLNYLKELRRFYQKSPLDNRAELFSEKYPSISILLMAETIAEPLLAKQLNEMDFKAVFREILQLEQDISRAYLNEERDRKIFTYYQALQLLMKLNQIKLTPSEYEAVKKIFQDFDTKQLAEFVVSLTGRSLVLSKEWEANIESSALFYDIAQERDKTISHHMKSFFQSENESAAILVFGGFHAGGIKEILREHQISYQVVSPRINSFSKRHHDYYQHLMTGGQHSFEKPFLSTRAARPPSIYFTAAMAGEENPIQSELREIVAAVDEGSDYDSLRVEHRRANFSPVQKKVEKKNTRSETRMQAPTLEGKNILIYAPALFTTNGVRTYLEGLLPALAEGNPNLTVHVVVLSKDYHDSPMADQFLNNGSKIFYHALPTAERDPQAADMIRQELKKAEYQKIDLVISHAPFHQAGNQFNLFAKGKDVPIIQEYHGGPWGRLGEPLPSVPDNNPGTVDILKGANMRVVPSQHVRDDFARDYGVLDAEVFNPVADMDFWDPEQVTHEQVQMVRREHMIESDFVVLMAGRVVPAKGFDVVVQAAKALRHRGKKVTLVISGPIDSANSRAYQEALAKDAGSAINLIFLGGLDKEKMRNWYAVCDVVVVPSLKPKDTRSGEETFGLVSVEAQSMGKPVIVSRVGGLPETLSDGMTGFVFKESDSNALRTYLQKFYDTPELGKEFGQRAAAYIQKRFDRSDLTRKHTEFYAGLINEYSRRSEMRTPFSLSNLADLSRQGKEDLFVNTDSIPAGHLKEFIQMLNEKKIDDVVVVGGAIRDSLLGGKVGDIDFSVRVNLPFNLQRQFEKDIKVLTPIEIGQKYDLTERADIKLQAVARSLNVSPMRLRRLKETFQERPLQFVFSGVIVGKYFIDMSPTAVFSIDQIGVDRYGRIYQPPDNRGLIDLAERRASIYPPTGKGPGQRVSLKTVLKGLRYKNEFGFHFDDKTEDLLRRPRRFLWKVERFSLWQYLRMTVEIVSGGIREALKNPNFSKVYFRWGYQSLINLYIDRSKIEQAPKRWLEKSFTRSKDRKMFFLDLETFGVLEELQKSGLNVDEILNERIRALQIAQKQVTDTSGEYRSEAKDIITPDEPHVQAVVMQAGLEHSDLSEYLPLFDLFRKASDHESGLIARVERILNNHFSPLQLKQDGDFLDVGASDGTITQVLMPSFKRGVAVEIDKHASQRLKSKEIPGLDVITVPIQEYVPDHKFDVILGSHSLYYIEEKDRMNQIKRMASWLKPGGKLILLYTVHGSSQKDLSRMKKALSVPSLPIDGRAIKDRLISEGFEASLEILESSVTADLDQMLRIAPFVLKKSSLQSVTADPQIREYIERNLWDETQHKYRLIIPQELLIISNQSGGHNNSASEVFQSDRRSEMRDKEHVALYSFESRNAIMADQDLLRRYSAYKYGSQEQSDYFLGMLQEEILKNFGDQIKSNPAQWVLATTGYSTNKPSIVPLARKLSAELGIEYVSVRAVRKERSSGKPLVYSALTTKEARDAVQDMYEYSLESDQSYEGKNVIFVDDFFASGSALRKINTVLVNKYQMRLAGNFVIISIASIENKDPAIEEAINSFLIHSKPLEETAALLNRKDTTVTRYAVSALFQMDILTFRTLAALLDDSYLAKLFIAAEQNHRDAVDLDKMKILDDRIRASSLNLETLMSRLNQQRGGLVLGELVNALPPAVLQPRELKGQEIERKEELIKAVRGGKLPGMIMFGDQHGDEQVLKRIMTQAEDFIEKNRGGNKKLEIIGHGDGFDEGVHNVEVFQLMKRLKQLEAENPGLIEVHLLWGNHDVVLMQANLPFADEEAQKLWLKNGGSQVRDEFSRANIPMEDVLRFMIENFEFFHMDKWGMMHVHAGIPVQEEGVPVIDRVRLGSIKDEMNELRTMFKSDPRGFFQNQDSRKRLDNFFNRKDVRKILWVREKDWLAHFEEPPMIDIDQENKKKLFEVMTQSYKDMVLAGKANYRPDDEIQRFNEREWEEYLIQNKDKLERDFGVRATIVKGRMIKARLDRFLNELGINGIIFGHIHFFKNIDNRVWGIDVNWHEAGHFHLNIEEGVQFDSLKEDKRRTEFSINDFLNRLEEDINSARGEIQSETLVSHLKQQNGGLVLVGGPSGAGKTTVAESLKEALGSSLLPLDFYPADQGATKYGTKSHELFISHDNDLIWAHVSQLLQGHAVDVTSPYYYEHQSTRTIDPSFNKPLIVDGLHAVNPSFIEGLPKSVPITKVFVDAPKQIRFMRRLLTVSNETDRMDALLRWRNVLEAEEETLDLSRNNADFILVEPEDVAEVRRLVKATAEIRAFLREHLADLDERYDARIVLKGILDDVDSFIAERGVDHILERRLQGEANSIRSKRKELKVGVLGASKPSQEYVVADAEELGRSLANYLRPIQGVAFTGGDSGVGADFYRGYHSKETPEDKFFILLPTGSQPNQEYERISSNHLSFERLGTRFSERNMGVSMVGDVFIAMNGSNGTMQEVTGVLKRGKPIVALNYGGVGAMLYQAKVSGKIPQALQDNGIDENALKFIILGDINNISQALDQARELVLDHAQVVNQSYRLLSNIEDLSNQVAVDMKRDAKPDDQRLISEINHRIQKILQTLKLRAEKGSFILGNLEDLLLGQESSIEALRKAPPVIVELSGTFDPPHLIHILRILDALSGVSDTADPRTYYAVFSPIGDRFTGEGDSGALWKPNKSPFEDRYQMTKLIAETFSPLLSVVDTNRDSSHNMGTIDMLTSVLASDLKPLTDFYTVTGTDNLEYLESHIAKDLSAVPLGVRMNFVLLNDFSHPDVVARLSSTYPDNVVIAESYSNPNGVSSTQIRNKERIGDLPVSIQKYIQKRALYGAVAGEMRAQNMTNLPERIKQREFALLSGISDWKKKDPRRYSLEELRAFAANIRAEGLKIWGKLKGPLAGGMSTADLYAVLFLEYVDREKHLSRDPERLRIVPKGTAGSTLYPAAAYAGLIEPDRVRNIDRHDLSMLPTRFGFGDISFHHRLGMSFDQSIGLALAGKIQKVNYPVLSFTTDGSLQIGVDHQAKFAALMGLNNLAVVLDVNGIQNAYKNEDVDPSLVMDGQGHLLRMKELWRSYGWEVMEIDGHNFDEIRLAYDKIGQGDRPLMILAKTVKGKGVPSIEGRLGYSHKFPSEEAYLQALGEVEAVVDEYEKKGYAPKYPDWVSVEQALPEKNEMVLPGVNLVHDEKLLAQQGKLYLEIVLKSWMQEFVAKNPGKVLLINTDNPSPFDIKTPVRSATNDSPFIFAGINERFALNLAGGLFVEGLVPVYIGPAAHMPGITEDWKMVGFDKQNVLVIGRSSGSALSSWGPGHLVYEDVEIFKNPWSQVLQPAHAEDLKLILENYYGVYPQGKPTYIRLPEVWPFEVQDVIFDSKEKRKKIFHDGFYLADSYEGEGDPVVFVVSGKTVKEALEAGEELRRKGMSFKVVNVLNLSNINKKAFVELTSGAGRIITAIDAVHQSLSSLVYDAVPGFRDKVEAFGVDDGGGFEAEMDILAQHKIDAQGLLATALRQGSVQGDEEDQAIAGVSKPGSQMKGSNSVSTSREIKTDSHRSEMRDFKLRAGFGVPIKAVLTAKARADRIVRSILKNVQLVTVFVNAEDFEALSESQKQEYLFVAFSNKAVRVVVYNERGQVQDKELNALLKLERVERTDKDLERAAMTFSRMNTPAIHLSKHILPTQALVGSLRQKVVFFKASGNKSGTLATAILWAISGGEGVQFQGVKNEDGFWTVAESLLDELQKVYENNFVFALAA